MRLQYLSMEEIILISSISRRNRLLLSLQRLRFWTRVQLYLPCSISKLTKAVVSAGSASSYLVGEVSLPFPEIILPVLVLIFFGCLCLFGIRESSRVALAIFLCHLTVVTMLGIASIVRWGINGNSLLSQNWHAAQPPTLSALIKQMFFGVSLGFLGNTGTIR